MAPKRKAGELGKEWLDPSKIPVDEIVDEWRSQSAKGRYESAMWRAAGLEEPGTRKANARDGGSSGELEGGEEVDNMAAGGFFGQYGRERTGARPTVIPPFARPAAIPSPASPDEVPAAGAADESEAESDGTSIGSEP